MRNGEVEQFLGSKDVIHKKQGGEVVVKFCPVCPKPHYNKPDNLWKVYIHDASGAFNCFRCQSKGSWFDLKKIYAGDREVSNMALPDQQSGFADYSHSYNSIIENQLIDIEQPYGGFRNLMYYPEGCKDAYAYLIRKPNSGMEGWDEQGIPYQSEGSRGIKPETLATYKVGIDQVKFRNDFGQLINYETVVYPLWSLNNQKECDDAMHIMEDPTHP